MGGNRHFHFEHVHSIPVVFIWPRALYVVSHPDGICTAACARDEVFPFAMPHSSIVSVVTVVFDLQADGGINQFANNFVSLPGRAVLPRCVRDIPPLRRVARALRRTISQHLKRGFSANSTGRVLWFRSGVFS